MFDVTRATSKLRVEGPCEKSNVVNEREKAWTDATEGLNDTGNDRLALGSCIAGEFVLFSCGSGKAGSGKGSGSVP